MLGVRDIHVSVVSHNQLKYVSRFLLDLDNLDVKERLQVTVTVNTPEETELDDGRFSFPIRVVKNSAHKGYGANHNAAFGYPPIIAERRFFLVANPDLRIYEDSISSVIEVLKEGSNAGVVGPTVVGENGQAEDSARELPTPLRLLAKIFGRSGSWNIDLNSELAKPDWVAGMFMAFRSEIFEEIGGFDMRYFMYYEDVDVCSRLWLAGYFVALVSSVSVCHRAQRKSRRNLKYMCWHLTSMIRFFLSPCYAQVKKFHSNRISIV